MSEFKRQARLFLRGPRILVLLAPILLLAPVWLTGKALYWGTPSTQFIPWWQQAWETLRHGELPLWNPLLGSGAPLLANYQSALLYPPTWIYLLLAAIGGVPPMAWGMAPLVAAHLAWAGLGMVLLVRRLGLGMLSQTVAGLAFGLSGYLVTRSHFLSINAAAAWLPWILWAIYALVQEPKIRRMLALVSVLALQWLAGHAQVAWYSLLLAVAWAAFWLWKQSDFATRRKAQGLLLAAVLLATGLGAAQLLPTMEYLLQSQRAADVGRELALNYSFWPWRLLGLLAPSLFGNPAWGDFAGLGNYWEEAIYIGLLSVFLALAALIGLRKRPADRSLRAFLLAATTLSLVLALGQYTPVFPWLYERIPTFSLFQAPARWTLWLVFALSLLAAYGLDAWHRPQGRALYWSRLAVAAGVAVLFAAFAGWLLRERLELVLPDSFLLASLHFGVIALVAAVLNLRAPEADGQQTRAWIWAVALLLAADLLLAGWGLNPGTGRDFYTQAAAAHPELAPVLDSGRLYLPPADEERLKFEHLFSFETFAIRGGPQALADSLLPNLTLLAGLPSANNFDPLLPARYQAYVDALATAPEAAQSAMLARLNVAVIQSVGEGDQIEFKAVEPLERARWLPCARLAEDAQSSLDLVAGGAVDPALGIIVELPGQGGAQRCAENSQAGTALITEQSANRLLVEVDAPAGGWLLLADAHYPGWRAYVDGVEAPIYAADSLFRGLELPVGARQVEFFYRPASFWGGAALSMLAILICGGLWMRDRRTHWEGGSGA